MTVRELLERLKEETEHNEKVLDYEIYFEECDGFEAFVYGIDFSSVYNQVTLS